MATSKADTYLHRPTGSTGTWYARVIVPRTLVKYVGQSHIRRSLKTTDKAEANRRKHAVVGEIKAELERLRKAPEKAQGRGISFAEAKAWREELKAAEARDDDGERHDAVHDAVINKAEELEQLFGTDKAQRWFKAATLDTTEEALSDLMDTWLKLSEFKASTNSAHRKALGEVLEYLKNDHAVPADVTRKVAVAYMDNDLTQRGLAHTTIRDRLVSLGGFWKWMQSRDAVPAGVNPWTGHKINKQANKGRSPPKREYTDEELLRLLAGNDRVQAWPTYAYIPDLIVLGMYTGARIESLCALQAERVEQGKDHCVLTIIKDKNEAGDRLVGITHPAPLAVLKRRLKGKKTGDTLFPELHPGGYDAKFSASASKAYGRYRRACEVPDGTDYHSFRRNVNRILENAEATQVAIARFVGHNIGTESGDTYSAGAAKRNTLATSRKVRYSARVEKAIGMGSRWNGGPPNGAI
jgi:integrase